MSDESPEEIVEELKASFKTEPIKLDDETIFGILDEFRWELIGIKQAIEDDKKNQFLIETLEEIRGELKGIRVGLTFIVLIALGALMNWLGNMHPFWKNWN